VALATATAAIAVNAVELILRELLENARSFIPRSRMCPPQRLDARRAMVRLVDDGRAARRRIGASLDALFQGEKYFTGQAGRHGAGSGVVASARGSRRRFAVQPAGSTGVVVELTLPLADADAVCAIGCKPTANVHRSRRAFYHWPSIARALRRAAGRNRWPLAPQEARS
jgi:hypothetical protein